jgi:four helix bundle protein
MQNQKENIILQKTIKFSLDLIEYVELLEEKRKFIISNQLLKSGTSIGANIHEAQNAESKADFIHKLKIAAKESEESQYWLLLCEYSKEYPDTKQLLGKLESIQKLLSKILSTAKRKTPLSYFLSFFIF